MFYFDYEIGIQPLTDVSSKSCYNKEPATLLKKNFQPGCFLVNYEKFVRVTIFKNTYKRLFQKNDLKKAEVRQSTHKIYKMFRECNEY